MAFSNRMRSTEMFSKYAWEFVHMKTQQKEEEQSIANKNDR